MRSLSGRLEGAEKAARAVAGPQAPDVIGAATVESLALMLVREGLASEGEALRSARDLKARWRRDNRP